MRRSLATRLTGACVRFAWPVILAAALLTAAAGTYAATHFRIDTNTDRLMPGTLPWVQREHAYQSAFPPKQVVADVQAPTPELAGDAATRLVAALRKDTGAVRSVEQPQGGAFAAHSGLLFLPVPQVQQVTAQLQQARPLLAELAADPTLRGAMQALAGSARMGPHAPDRASALFAATLEAAFAGRYAAFSWQTLLRGQDPSPADLRQLLPIGPVLDFAAL